MAERVAELPEGVVKEFFAEEEVINGPPILAERVEIHTNVNSTTGLPNPGSEPIAVFNNVYVINTNMRFVLTYRGLLQYAEVSDTSAYEGSREDGWLVERTKKIRTFVGGQSELFSLIKGKTRVSFRLGLGANTTFITGISVFHGKAGILGIIGLILLVLGIVFAVVSPRNTVAGLIFIIVGIILIILSALISVTKRKVLIINPSTEVGCIGDIYILNMLMIPREKHVRIVGEGTIEEHTLFDVEFVVMRITTHPAEDPERIMKFIRVISMERSRASLIP